VKHPRTHFRLCVFVCVFRISVCVCALVHVKIPKIPLWVMAQSAIVSLETETDAGAATKGSPSGSPRSKASSAGRSPLPRSKSKITAVRIAQRERFFQ
jgi:hypothetical protein